MMQYTINPSRLSCSFTTLHAPTYTHTSHPSRYPQNPFYWNFLLIGCMWGI